MNEKFLSIDEAVQFLQTKGFPVKKSTLYKHTMVGTIPFNVFGKRKLLFSEANLLEWCTKMMEV